MRILFVSGTSIGGSAHSTRELAERLVARGHDVAILFRVEGDPRVRHLHKRAINLVVKLGTSPLARPVDRVAAQLARRPRRVKEPVPYEVWETVIPENSVPTLLEQFRPDVVVASSLSRMGWRRIRTLLREQSLPGVLYLREQSALGHLTISHAPPDLLMANAHTYVEMAAELGHVAVMVPSVVTVDRYLVESTRERVLFVNPVPSYGLEAALALAAARPDVRFAFVEWWELDDLERADLEARLAQLPNVVLRPATPDPSAVYADARVLLAPFLLDGRPRVVLEAQANGIPVLASDLPALRETVGPSGHFVAADAPVADWAAALGDLIDDPGRYRKASESARSHARRDEVDPDVIVGRFERALADLVASFHDPARGPRDSSGASTP
jgi:glycosyltransferase involved in cell wall biosynthesis